VLSLKLSSSLGLQMLPLLSYLPHLFPMANLFSLLHLHPYHFQTWNVSIPLLLPFKMYQELVRN